MSLRRLRSPRFRLRAGDGGVLGSSAVAVAALAAATMAVPPGVQPGGSTGRPIAGLDQASADAEPLERYSLQPLPLGRGTTHELATTVRLGPRSYTLLLEPTGVRSPRFQVWIVNGTGRSQRVAPPQESTFRGRLLEDAGSAVAASVQGGRLRAVVRLGNGEIWGIEPAAALVPSARGTDHMVYREADVKVGPWSCGAPHGGPVFESNHAVRVWNHVQENSASAHAGGSSVPGEASAPLGPLLQVADVAFDADVEFFQRNGSSINATVADIEAIVNGVNLIYQTDVFIHHRVSTVVIRTAEPDPYTATNSNLLLNQLRDEWTANQSDVVRDAAHLMTGKNVDGNVVGIAFRPGMCAAVWPPPATPGPFAYGLSQSRFSTAYSLRVALTAHELGHNWNARHCNEPPLDDTDCAIMCSSIGQCTRNVSSFGSRALDDITDFRRFLSLAVGCLETFAPRLELIPDSTCLQPGETLTVTLRMTDLGVVKASGFQAFLSFDPAVLSFVGGSYTDTPFGFQFPIETVDGSIRLAAGVVPGNQSPSSQDADLATLTFTAAAALCGGAVVGFDRAHQPPTRLSSAGGPEIPGLGLIDTPRVVIDGTAPVLTCPPAVAVSCDASTDPRVNPVVGLAMAGDACGGTPTVSFSDAVNPGVCPRESTIMRTWTAADDCLNSAMCFQIITVVDESVPLITCPEDLAVDADAGTCGALLDPGSAAAVDACDNNPTLFAKRSDGLLLSDPFPVGTTAVTWRATDDCGNIAECTQQIVVNPFSELIVDVAFAPAVSTPLSRCITFEFRDCAVPVPVVVEQEVTFVNGLATDVVVRVPCGSYTCLSARDRLHTLTRTDVDDFGILQGRFVADFTDRAAAPGDDDSLVGGNFNDDSFIDMLDFEIFSEQWASDYGTGDTSCLVGGPHADASGNGVVLTEDFTFVQVNFLQGSDAACCGGDSASRPVREVSEAELRRLGLEQLTVGDLDGNGVLDAADVALFIRGVRPRAQAGEIRRPATRKSRR